MQYIYTPYHVDMHTHVLLTSSIANSLLANACEFVSLGEARMTILRNLMAMIHS